MKKTIIAGVFAAVAAFTVTAGVPLTNTQGVGGIAYNPLAYPAGQPWPEGTADPLGLTELFGKPQVGAWYVNLGDVDVDWTTFGTAISIRQRLELSYGHEIVAQSGADTIHKHNLGAKLLLIPEHAGDHAWVPAVAVGAIWKHTDADLPGGVDSTGVDVYLVGTKLVTQTPWPVLLSAGLLSSQERVTGVYGHDGDRDLTWFGNIAVLPLPNLAVGFEYKQGSSYDTFRNADYWDAHVAWFVTPSLTLVGAYVDGGSETSTSRVGLGDGFVVSLHYTF